MAVATIAVVFMGLAFVGFQMTKFTVLTWVVKEPGYFSETWNGVKFTNQNQ